MSNRAVRRAIKQPAAWRGSAERCPKCGSHKTAFDFGMSFQGYGPGLATCLNCGALWEPVDVKLIWDRSDPVCSSSEPCNNCAFRPGSNEQQDREKWRSMIASLKAGASFYCHKGVPIEPDSEHGFAYPSDSKKLRVCRGYLNALGKWWKAA